MTIQIKLNSGKPSHHNNFLKLTLKTNMSICFKSLEFEFGVLYETTERLMNYGTFQLAM